MFKPNTTVTNTKTDTKVMKINVYAAGKHLIFVFTLHYCLYIFHYILPKQFYLSGMKPHGYFIAYFIPAGLFKRLFVKLSLKFNLLFYHININLDWKEYFFL